MEAPFLAPESSGSSQDWNVASQETVIQRHPWRVHGSRYFQLILLCILILNNAVVWVAFSAITPATAAVYGVSPGLVNIVALSFQMLFLPGTIAGYMLKERWGLRLTLLAGAFMTAVSAAIRFVSLYVPPVSFRNASTDGHDVNNGGCAYALLLLGTSLAALAQPLLLNTPPDLAVHWFAVKERDLVTSLAFMCSPLGSALGVTLAPLFVSEAGADTEEDISGNHRNDARGGLRLFLLAQLGMGVATTLLAHAGATDRPPTPPSRAAALGSQREEERVDSSDALGSRVLSMPLAWQLVVPDLRRCLLCNPSFLLLLFCFGIGLGFFNALLTLLGQLLAPCGYPEAEAGALGGIFLGTGLVGAVMAGLLMDASHRYGLLLKGGFLGAWAASLFLVFTLRPDNFLVLALCFGLLGFTMLPLLPVAIENGVEITYPDVPEFFSSGLLLSAGNLTGIPLAFLFAWTIDSYEGSCRKLWKPAAVLVVVVTTACALPVLGYRPRAFGRWEAEKEQRREGLEGCGHDVATRDA